MIVQAAFGHVLVHEEEIPVLHAVAQQPHQVRMRQPPQKVHLRLQNSHRNVNGLEFKQGG